MATRSFMTVRDSATVVFPFLSFRGDPVPKRQHLERVMRAGVDGIGLLRHANRGQPFAVSTFVDVLDSAAVTTTREAYLAARGTVLDLYWQGVLFDHVLIHDVRTGPWRVISGSVGGEVTNSTRVVPAVWQLEAVT